MAASLRDQTLSAAARTAAREVVADYGRVALGQASVAEIDRLNILRASLLAMARAVTASPRSCRDRLIASATATAARRSALLRPGGE